MVSPRIQAIPPGLDYTIGDKAIQLADASGVHLDDWQKYVLRHSLARRDDGKWAAFEVGLNVPRQNGKGEIILTRELASLFLDELADERYAIHSSHQQDTSLDAQVRLWSVIEDDPELRAQMLRPRFANGQEELRHKNGSKIRFRTRTKGGGRGFSCDLLVLDEAMFIPESAHSALLPTLSARSMKENPQILYAGSAVDQEFHDHGLIWSRVRERGIAGDDPSLAYFEYSVDLDHPEKLSKTQAADQDLWKQANPALGIRIAPEYVEKELRAMEARGFAVERLGIGDYHRTDGVEQDKIDIEDWKNLVDLDSRLVDPICIAFDVDPRRHASVVAAGGNQDGNWHVEVVKAAQGTSWVIPMLLQLQDRHNPEVILADDHGPAGSLVQAAQDAGIPLELVTAGDVAAACGRLVDAVEEKTLRHLGTDELMAAIRGAKSRPLGDAWAWSRKNSSVDISPLVAATLALSAAMDQVDTGVQIY